MTYTLTLEQQSILKSKIPQDRLLTSDYSAAYQYVADLLFEKHGSTGISLADLDPKIRETALWFAGAAQVNAGEGVFSVLIRQYTAYQLSLRDPNWATSLSLIQSASGKVALNALDNMAENGWEIPTLNEIAANQWGQTRMALT